MKLDPYLCHDTVNSKWIQDLNLRAKTIKIIEENIGQKLHNIGFANDFLDITPKAKATKVKRDELNYIEIKKNSCIKGHINRMKKATHGIGRDMCKSCI